MKTLTRLIVPLAICAVTGIGANGCNTFRGAGQDIQAGGQAIENSANNADNARSSRTVQNAQANRATPVNRQHAIITKSDFGGSINPADSINVPYGGMQTFTIEPYAGYRVSNVFVDGKSVGPLGSYTFKHVTSFHTISAQFDSITER